jgi:nitrogen regulatory protein PII
MSEYKKKNNFSLVSVVVPKHNRTNVVKLISNLGARNIIRITARGTLVQEGAWYTKIFPAPSPELEVMNVIVPDCHVDSFFEKVISASKMHVSGNGLIYSIPLNDIEYSESYPVWEVSDEENALNASETSYDKNLVGIFCIIERSGADAMAKGAIHSGAHSPVVTFAEGRGLRDKIRLLRLTKTAEKEFVQVIVEETDSDLVFTEMAKEGKITEPGKGFLYATPVKKALINLPGIVEETKHSASIQQIITAIDDIKGGRDWRKRDTEEFASKGSRQKLVYLRDLVSVTCVTPREHSDTLIDAALEAGAPAASIGFGSMKDVPSEKDSEMAKINREWGFIYLALAPNKVDSIKDAIKKKADEAGIDEVCFYTIPVPKALTYLGK